MLARLVKPTLMFSAVFITVWVIVVVYWNYTARMPSTSDIALYLVVLPLALVVFYLVLRRIFASPPPAVALPPTARGASAATGAAASTGATADAQQQERLQMAVLAFALHTPRGNDADAVATAVGQAQAPELVPELRDGEGFPMLAGCVAGLDANELREHLRETLRPAPEAFDADALTDDRLRAIHLMSDVLQELLASATDAILNAGDALSVRAPGRFVSSGEVIPGPAAAPYLCISLLLPGAWSESERAIATQWVQQLAREADPSQHWTVDCFKSEAGVSAMALLDRINLALHREQRPALWIALAADSAISNECIARWEAEGLLHSAARRNGRVPGEAAAGLLLARAGDGLFAQPHGLVLSRSASGQRDESADTARMPDASLLDLFAQRLLSASAVQPDTVDWVVSDADHRTSRVTEVAKLVQERLPHVPFENNLSVCASLGHLGAAADMTAVALACHLAVRDSRHVLALSVQDARARTAMLAGPASPPTPPNSVRQAT
ncbi:hypothetical protein [Variovorax paradoxus]|uniref:3-oxoacyl-ACP synthase n=1 Tax=Variovorax paradoxus (strain EPS) TaxID=595537 RepID=E6VAF4_VARPE|nr:hypothetical protein [Variovorax paradoxus]ADU39698.1 hypothetical protein Varpa_5543 [Variovorax paradoxus EPS]